MFHRGLMPVHLKYISALEHNTQTNPSSEKVKCPRATGQSSDIVQVSRGNVRPGRLRRNPLVYYKNLDW